MVESAQHAWDSRFSSDGNRKGRKGREIEIETPKEHLPSESVFTAKTQRTPRRTERWECEEPPSTGALRHDDLQAKGQRACSLSRASVSSPAASLSAS